MAQFLPNGLPPDAVKSTAPREVEGRCRDGQAVPLEVPSAKTEVGGEAIHTLILRDVTEWKRAEEGREEIARQRDQALFEPHSMMQQLWQAARLAEVGELVAIIAHELNNPPATVSLRVGVPDKIPPGEPQGLGAIEQEIELMARLVANLLPDRPTPFASPPCRLFNY